MSLTLPASDHEIVDILERLGLEDMGSLYFEIEKYHKGKFLGDALESSITIREMDILTRKVAEMDKGQEAVFEGLTKMELKNQPVSHLSYQKLLQMAENTDCYHRVPQARNDGQLGRFYAENGFAEGVDELPDKLFELLDFEQIGRKMRLAEGGVFTGGGYVVQHEELRELEKLPDLGFRRPYYTLLLEISQAAYPLPFLSGTKAIQSISLPAPGRNGLTVMLFSPARMSPSFCPGWRKRWRTTPAMCGSPSSPCDGKIPSGWGTTTPKRGEISSPATPWRWPRR